MAGAVASTLSQKDLTSAVRVIAAAEGWRVIELHAARQNPEHPSVPDLLITKVGHPPVMVKCQGAKGKLSKNQLDWLAHFEAVGFATATYHPADFTQILEALVADERVREALRLVLDERTTDE